MEAAPIPEAFFSLSSYDRTVEIDDRDLSATANQLLSDSNSFAAELGHRLVEPVHVAFLLFSGISLPGKEAYSDLGGRILCRAGVLPSEATGFLRDELELCERSAATANHNKVSFSHGFVDFMRDARQEARIFADQLIGVDHLAIAAAIHMAEYGAQIGFNYEAFRLASEKVRGIRLLPDDAANKDDTASDSDDYMQDDLYGLPGGNVSPDGEASELDGRHQLPHNSSIANNGVNLYTNSATASPHQQPHSATELPQTHTDESLAALGGDEDDGSRYTDAELARLLQQAEVDASRAELDSEDIQSYQQDQQLLDNSIDSVTEEFNGEVHLHNLRTSEHFGGRADQQPISPASSAPDSPEAPLTLAELDLLGLSSGKPPPNANVTTATTTNSNSHNGNSSCDGGVGPADTAVEPERRSVPPLTLAPNQQQIQHQVPQRPACVWSNGVAVERELDGMWYPARVERARDDGCYDILYLDDGNREAAVEPEELRLAAEPAVASPNALQKAGGGQPPSEEAATKTDSDDEEYEAILARYRLAQQENPSFNDDL